MKNKWSGKLPVLSVLTWVMTREAGNLLLNFIITLTDNELLLLHLADCNSALGLEDFRIQDSQLTAQSYYESLSIEGGISVDTHPRCARLNNNCAWCAPRGSGQYLQVDLRRDFIITGIATQGLEALVDYYVRKYKVSHSRDGHTWSTVSITVTWLFVKLMIILIPIRSGINNNHNNKNCPHKSIVYNIKMIIKLMIYRRINLDYSKQYCILSPFTSGYLHASTCYKNVMNMPFYSFIFHVQILLY